MKLVNEKWLSVPRIALKTKSSTIITPLSYKHPSYISASLEVTLFKCSRFRELNLRGVAWRIIDLLDRARDNYLDIDHTVPNV